MAKADLTLSYLRSRFVYDKESGVITRVRSPSGSEYIPGIPVNGTNAYGYVQVAIAGRPYLGHRLAWFLVNGEWPICQIDHMNGVRSDNRWENLRAATSQENKENIRHSKRHSSTGLLGVSKVSGSNRWFARIQTNGVSKHIGTFSSPEDAHAAYLREKRLQHLFATI